MAVKIIERREEPEDQNPKENKRTEKKGKEKGDVLVTIWKGK